MSNLRACGDCGHAVSPNAETCPNCGAVFVSRPKRHGVFYYVCAVILSLIAINLLVWGGCILFVGGASVAGKKMMDDAKARRVKIEQEEKAKEEAKAAQEKTARDKEEQERQKTQLELRQIAIEAQRSREAEAKAARDASYLKFITEKAQGGSGRHQFELGQHYLSESNNVLAEMWLKAACDNEVIEACKLLTNGLKNRL